VSHTDRPARLPRVAPELEASGAGTTEVETRRLVGDRVQILFVFNHAQRSGDTAIVLRSPWLVKRAQDFEDDRPVAFETRGGSIILHKSLTEGAIWVVQLERETRE
jgi:hypothetical protein